MTFKLISKAPISKALRSILMRDAKDLKSTAKRKGVTLDSYEEQRESAAAQNHFELGCWLHRFTTLRHLTAEQSLKERIDIVEKIMLSGFNNPGYDFYTVFDFGERQFDGIFEEGDSKAVIAGLRSKIATDKTGLIACSFAYFGWPINGETNAVSYGELELPYTDAAAALRSKQAALQNYHDELQVFLELRDKMRDHPDFPGHLPETYYSGGDLDPVGAGCIESQSQLVF